MIRSLPAGRERRPGPLGKESWMSRQSRPFSAVAAILLAVVALAHLLRGVLAVDVVGGGRVVPIAASVLATVVAGLLSVGTWRESRG